MCASSINLGDFALDGAEHIELLVCAVFFVLFLLLLVGGKTDFQHLDSLCLLADGNLVAALGHDLDVLLQCILGKGDCIGGRPRRHNQVHVLVANGSILIVHDEPARPPIEQNTIEVLGLALPVALHARSQLRPLGLGYEHRARVVLRIIGPALLAVHDVLSVGEPRAFLVSLDGSLGVPPAPVRPHILALFCRFHSQASQQVLLLGPWDIAVRPCFKVDICRLESTFLGSGPLSPRLDF